MIFHPCCDQHGHPVRIHHPHEPSPPAAWADPAALATTVPRGTRPDSLNGIALAPWGDAPTDAAGWMAQAQGGGRDEPAFSAGHAHPSAGAVILEPDGRVWVVSPTNAFAGYQNTFPKGQPESGLSLMATAIKETFEESGLRIQIRGHLIDVARSTTVARYYLAQRLGGDPSAMGWESQAVHLVPVARLAAFVGHPKDQPILAALQQHLQAP